MKDVLEGDNANWLLGIVYQKESMNVELFKLVDGRFDGFILIKNDWMSWSLGSFFDVLL